MVGITVTLAVAARVAVWWVIATGPMVANSKQALESLVKK